MNPSAGRRAQGDRAIAAGTLYVVGTPIGNLEDITLRALRVLRDVAVVAAEDTRRTGNLLRHYEIQTPLISLHEHNERQRLTPLVARLQAGDSIAVVSDAGTPGISDPGARLVRAARDAGVRVDPIPGPSAVTAVLSASGLTFDRFAFAGFAPVRSNDRKLWFAWVGGLADVPVVCFEAPHRIRRLLADAASMLAKRPILIAREVTKAHEQWLSVTDDFPERGEFVVIFCQSTESAPAKSPSSDEQVQAIFGQMTNAGTPGSRRELVKAVAKQLQMPVKAVYDALERAKKQPA
jgi:16S rRNA (cytidine1402-2'-O)-methyltransferase